MTTPLPTDGHPRPSMSAEANTSESADIVAPEQRFRMLIANRQARAELGGISREKLRQLTLAGEVETVLIGRRRFFVTDSLRAFVARNRARTA